MRRSSFIAAALVATAAAACGSTIKAPRTRLTPKQIIERSKPAIVRVEVHGADGTPGLGTGFVVGEDGRIATNLHVIHGVVQANVVMFDGTTYPVEQVVAVDEQHDLAIIRIDRGGLPTLRFGDSDKVAAGDPVYAIGNPLGADYTISDGLISAVRSLDEPPITILQVSAPISQGSSGGPLLNHYGEVIGVATWLLAAGQNLNFGMPVNYLRPMLDEQGGMEFAEFARRSAAETPTPPGGDAARPKIVRRVPEYEVSYLDGCTDEQLRQVAEEIAAAIEKGAPIYNDGDHETCFRIYEGTALRLENELPPACVGPREGLGQGLLRAGTLETYTEKAWAMRDAFDGLLNVIVERLR